MAMTPGRAATLHVLRCFHTQTKRALKFKGFYYCGTDEKHRSVWSRSIQGALLFDWAASAAMHAANNHITHHPKLWQRGPGQSSADAPFPEVVRVLVTEFL